jgi:hypothetical protein
MNETLTIGTPSPELLVRAEDALALAQSYRIDCVEMRTAAAEDLQRVKALAKEVDEQRKGITGPLDLAKKRVMDLFRKPAEFLELAETTIKRACVKWDLEQERQRREAQAAAAAAADAERRRLADEAERQRVAGNTETAHAIAAAAQMVAPISVASDKPKIAGESMRELWRAEVTDIVALARAVADGKASSECLLPNMPALNAQARALKATLALPGVKAVSERVLASRALEAAEAGARG